MYNSIGIPDACYQPVSIQHCLMPPDNDDVCVQSHSGDEADSKTKATGPSLGPTLRSLSWARDDDLNLAGLLNVLDGEQAVYLSDCDYGS